MAAAAACPGMRKVDGAALPRLQSLTAHAAAPPPPSSAPQTHKLEAGDTIPPNWCQVGSEDYKGGMAAGHDAAPSHFRVITNTQLQYRSSSTAWQHQEAGAVALGELLIMLVGQERAGRRTRGGCGAALGGFVRHARALRVHHGALVPSCPVAAPGPSQPETGPTARTDCPSCASLVCARACCQRAAQPAACLFIAAAPAHAQPFLTAPAHAAAQA